MNFDYEPGPLMDSFMARRLWGSIVVHDCVAGTVHMVSDQRRIGDLVPPYSTDIMASKRVVEKLATLGFILRIRNASKGVFKTSFRREDDGLNYLFSEASDLPMAICLAALAALDGSNVRKNRKAGAAPVDDEPADRKTGSDAL